MLPKIITFDTIVRFSINLVLWKLDIQSFLGTPRSAQSKSEKILKHAFKAGPKKPELLMSTGVAGGLCMVGSQRVIIKL